MTLQLQDFKSNLLPFFNRTAEITTDKFSCIGVSLENFNIHINIVKVRRCSKMAVNF